MEEEEEGEWGKVKIRKKKKKGATKGGKKREKKEKVRYLPRATYRSIFIFLYYHYYVF